MPVKQYAAAMPTSPLVDPASGEITPAWRMFLLSLYERTGSAPGQPPINGDEIKAQIDAEEAARIAADNAINSRLTAETNARQDGDAAAQYAVRVEADTRQSQDALLVPLVELATLWAGQDLAAVLPTSNPGGGKPWLNGTTVSVG